MIKTVLMIVLLNTSQPQVPATMVHKSFESPAACQKAAEHMRRVTPTENGMRIDMFCEPVWKLADEVPI